jgi:GT2 family glycosyltransferase
VTFLDDDVECPREYVAKLKTTWERHSEAFAIGGPAIFVDDEGETAVDINTSSENLNWINKYGEQRSSEGVWRPPEPVATDQLVGANMSIRSGVLDRLGGFNDIYLGSAMYEETDLMARIRRRGGTIIYDSGLEVKHYETPKAGAENERKEFYWSGLNAIIFRYVCFPETFWISLLRLLTVNPGWLYPVWVRIGAAPVKNTAWLWILKGYVYGLRYVIQNHDSLPRDTNLSATES